MPTCQNRKPADIWWARRDSNPQPDRYERNEWMRKLFCGNGFRRYQFADVRVWLLRFGGELVVGFPAEPMLLAMERR